LMVLLIIKVKIWLTALCPTHHSLVEVGLTTLKPHRYEIITKVLWKRTIHHKM
jgi:hypothetical protein